LGPGWEILVADNVIGAVRDEALSHEWCHVYEVEVLGRSVWQTAQHEGWIRN